MPTTLIPFTWFLASSKADGETGRADGWASELSDTLNTQHRVVDGREVHHEVHSASRVWAEESAEAGGFGNWANYLATKQRPNGAPFYQAVVVPVRGDVVIGRPTGNIVRNFLDAGRPVLVWHPVSNTMAVVTACEKTGSRSWATYWELTTERVDDVLNHKVGAPTAPAADDVVADDNAEAHYGRTITHAADRSTPAPAPVASAAPDTSDFGSPF